MNKKNRVKILLIEDDQLLCDQFRTKIKPDNDHMDVAHNGKDGLARFGAEKYDIVATEYQLPDISGIDVARKLLKNNPFLLILLMTQKGCEEQIAEALSIGVDSYIIKDDECRFLELIPSVITQMSVRGQRRQRLLKAEHDAQQNARRYKAIVAASPVCIHEIDLDGKLTSMNPAGLKMMSVDDESEIYGLRYLDVPIDEDKQRIADLMTRAQQGEGSAFEFRASGENGYIHFASSFEPIRDESGKVIQLMGLTQDVTAQKMAEEEMKRARKEAEDANHAKSEFLASMSHDLRTPLNAIMGFSEMMSEKTFGPLGDEHYTQYVKDIHRSGKLLVSLINGILDLSKIEAGKYELTEDEQDIAKLIKGSLELNAMPAKARNIRLVEDIQSNLSSIFIDDRPVTQIFNNLLSNAIKFTPQGGKAVISARSDATGDLVVSVADNGIGMSEKDIEKALKPFEQASSISPRKHEGTGLGLYICCNLMRLMGGNLEIESKVDEGTTVVLRFPFTRNVLS